MIREIFVPLLRTPADPAAMQAAMALAAAKEAHLTASLSITHPLPLVSEFGMIVVEPDLQALERERGNAADHAARAREQLSQASVAGEVRVTECFTQCAEDSAALQALHCDLSVLGHPGRDEASPGSAFARMFRTLLLRSGRAVLVVPQGARLDPPFRRVVLAWKPTPEASRAFHESLPLLSRAAEIDVLVVDPISTEGGYGEQPGADAARLLARHGFKARLVERAREGMPTGACVLRHAREVGADLLVMGGYGHRRWRELVLGGATRDVCADPMLPVLFSH